MLNIYFGNKPDVIYDTATYFKNTYKDSWITSPLSVEMIKFTLLYLPMKIWIWFWKVNIFLKK